MSSKRLIGKGEYIEDGQQDDKSDLSKGWGAGRKHGGQTGEKM